MLLSRAAGREAQCLIACLSHDVFPCAVLFLVLLLSLFHVKLFVELPYLSDIMYLSLRTLSLVTLSLNALVFPQFASSLPTHEEKDTRGAVASESAVCSKIGISLLKQGGNAADALVGTVLCIGVIGMYHSGYASRLLKPKIFLIWWLLMILQARRRRLYVGAIFERNL